MQELKARDLRIISRKVRRAHVDDSREECIVTYTVHVSWAPPAFLEEGGGGGGGGGAVRFRPIQRGGGGGAPFGQFYQ